jgi:hypothetical protein
MVDRREYGGGSPMIEENGITKGLFSQDFLKALSVVLETKG